MNWLVSRSVSSILFSRLEGFLDRGWGLSLSRSRWWCQLVFPDRCRVVCLAFLCVGAVGVFFELFVFFGGYFWRWICFSSFCVASWTTSWSGVFLLRSSFAIEWFWFVSEFSLVGGCQPFVCRGVEVAGLAFLWMAFLVAGVVGVSLWRLGALCVSCSFGGSCCSVGGGFWISSY